MFFGIAAGANFFKRKRTICIDLTGITQGPWRSPYTDHFVDFLRKDVKVDLAKIESVSIHPLAPYCLFKVKTDEYFEELLPKVRDGILWSGKGMVSGYRCDDIFTEVKVQGVSSETDKEEVLVYMQVFGEIIGGIRMGKVKGTNIHDGTYYMRMILTESIPSLVPHSEDGEMWVVRHEGQDQTCFKCFGTGHMSRNCEDQPNQFGKECRIAAKAWKAKVLQEAEQERLSQTGQGEDEEEGAIQQELDRLAEVASVLEQSRLGEAARVLEHEHLAEEARVLEQERLAEEARVLDMEHLAEEARVLEQERFAEEARVLEMERLAKEAEDRQADLDKQQDQASKQVSNLIVHSSETDSIGSDSSSGVSKEEKKKAKKDRQRMKKEEEILDDDEKKRKANEDLNDGIAHKKQSVETRRNVSPKEKERFSLAGGLVLKEAAPGGSVEAPPLKPIFQHIQHSPPSSSKLSKLEPIMADPVKSKITKENRTGI